MLNTSLAFIKFIPRSKAFSTECKVDEHKFLKGSRVQGLSLHFFQLLLMKLLWEKDENKQKEARIGPYKKFTMMAL